MGIGVSEEEKKREMEGELGTPAGVLIGANSAIRVWL